MAKRCVLLGLVLFVSLAVEAATTRNDDSCDLAALPAATLLLPYFEVDVDDDMNGTTTLFTITNVTSLDQIATVTLWTDQSFPVIDFNIYLTGYDVQAINLFDIIVRGIIAPESGTGTDVSKRGKYSDVNPARALGSCDRLPGVLDDAYVRRMQDAFLLGTVAALGPFPGCPTAGQVHANAVGYATIDVMRTCTFNLPTDGAYWTSDIAFDNVLTGDYQQINRGARFAEGGPMVHIRAVPEGGTAQERSANPSAHDAGFPRTFYSRYQATGTPRLDARQPLPSTFAARWIDGGPAAFATSMKVWREGRAGRGATCASYEPEARLQGTELVVFDEQENAVADLPQCTCTFDPSRFIFPPTSLTAVHEVERYPQPANGAISGWIYFNLQTPGVEGYATQSWVIASMRAENQFSVDMDATALGNGCSPPVQASEIGEGTITIGPAPNGN